MAEPETYELVSSNTDLYADLEVPTKSDGATIKQSSWEFGARTSSKGTISENPYTDLVTRLVVHPNHVEIGVLLDEDARGLAEAGATPNRTIRIDVTDITDIRVEDFHLAKLILETADDVYEFTFNKKNPSLFGGGVDVEQIEPGVEFLLSRQTEAQKETKEEQQPSEPLADELERLSQLHKEGSLSEEEFERAKSQLLDSR